MATFRNLNLGEAAEVLGIDRRRLRILIERYDIPTTSDPLDFRKRLIDEEGLSRLRAVLSGAESRSNGRAKRPWPTSIGLVPGPVTVRSDEVDDYLRDHWRPD